MISTAIQDKLIDTLSEVAASYARSDLNKGLYSESEPGPKSFFTDPFQYLDHQGIGYREQPNEMTYGTLKAMSERDSVVSAIIQTRQNQVAAFCEQPRNKYAVGFRIVPKNKDRKITDSERRHMKDLECFLMLTGHNRNDERDDFETFVRKIVRDSLRFDQVNFEVIPRRNGKPHSFVAVDPGTIRILKPKKKKGGYATTQSEYIRPKYAQIVQGRVVTEYTEDELAFGVRNPRTDLYVGGYGMSECELLILTITAHLWAEEWNRKVFSQGSTTKGIFMVKGNIPPNQLEAFRRHWQQSIQGVSNAWRTPILNADDGNWISLQPTNMEMGYSAWIEYLIKVSTAVYQIDPAEINFDMRGGGMSQAPMFMTTNEAQQKVSRDRGLNPLLRFIERTINKKVISRIDDYYEFKFVGIDQKSEEQAIQLRLQEVQNYKTLDEVREEDDLPPVKNGDIILNPIYTAYMQQKEMMAQQQQEAGNEAETGEPLPPGSDTQMPFEDEERNAGEGIRRLANGEDDLAMSGSMNLMKSLQELTVDLPL